MVFRTRDSSQGTPENAGVSPTVWKAELRLTRPRPSAGMNEAKGFADLIIPSDHINTPARRRVGTGRSELIQKSLRYDKLAAVNFQPASQSIR